LPLDPHLGLHQRDALEVAAERTRAMLGQLQRCLL